MKKKRKKAKTKSRSQSQLNAEATPNSPDRRNLLRLFRNGAIAVPVLGAVGYFSVRSVQATICEADLTKVGQGRPTIVQIHDPSCNLCLTLQRQSRKALKSYDNDSYEFLVANIKTAEGGSFAADYGVPHVTLLLFDGEGEMVQVVRGPIGTPELRTIFDAHMAEYG